MNQPAPSIGLATQLGVGVSVTAFVGAILAFVAGDHSEQTLGTIVGGAIGIISAVVTMLGRYAQAKEGIRSGVATSQRSNVSGTPMSTLVSVPHFDTPIAGPDASMAPDAYRDEVPGGSVPVDANERDANAILGRRSEDAV